ncbi:MAG: alcohol dehydrogenase catalytic domain-containing protein [Caulobacterales bacterium]
MRAAIFQKSGEPLVCVSAADPEPGAGDLIVKVSYSGICGTDLHLTQPGMETPLPAGMILGHEFSGEVVGVGRDAAAGWKTGERVTVMPYRACPACGAVCKDGLDIICPSVSYLGIAAPGGNAEYVCVGAAQAIRLPGEVDDKAGALTEPLAVGLHAVRKAGTLLGQSVLVIGGGPVGLAVALFASLSGARRVVVSEPHQVRRQRALQMGATDVLDPAAAPLAEAFRDLTGSAPDVVFECVGVPGMIQEAITQSRLFGQVIVVGACMERDFLHPLGALTKEIDMRFALGHTRADFQFVVDCLGRGAIQPDAMVTGVVGFQDFPVAFEALRTAKESCKVLLKPH